MVGVSILPFESFVLDAVQPRPERELPKFLMDAWKGFFLSFRAQFPALREAPEAEFTARFEEDHGT
jgi:hypothetical protein